MCLNNKQLQIAYRKTFKKTNLQTLNYLLDKRISVSNQACAVGLRRQCGVIPFGGAVKTEKQLAVWQTALYFPLRLQASLRGGITPPMRRDPFWGCCKNRKTVCRLANCFFH